MAYVRSHPEYCAVVWYSYSSVHVESLQRRATNVLQVSVFC